MCIHIIQHNLIYFGNIITQCISCIMTLHTTNSLPFREICTQVLKSSLWFSQTDTKVSMPVEVLTSFLWFSKTDTKVSILVEDIFKTFVWVSRIPAKIPLIYIPVKVNPRPLSGSVKSILRFLFQLKFSQVFSRSVKPTPIFLFQLQIFQHFLWFSQTDTKVSILVEDVLRLSSRSAESPLRFP